MATASTMMPSPPTSTMKQRQTLTDSGSGPARQHRGAGGGEADMASK
jgi:hypothetical protein